MRVLVTGADGMIGSYLVKGLLEAGIEVIGLDKNYRKDNSLNYKYILVDLSDKKRILSIVEDEKPDRIIHLAALAHSVDGKDYTWDKYKHVNVSCAKNVFDVAGDIPVLYISTVDVFGFTKGIVNPNTEPHPVSRYAKSKILAEEECKKLKHYTIFRLSPVYTDEIKRDIQKRYYLKYPYIAYQIGKGTEYEILNINNAIQAMIRWCTKEVINDIQIIKDSKMMNTADYIKKEREAGRAKVIIYFPKWIVALGYKFLAFTGENKYTYLISKAVYPLRTENLYDI